MMISHKISQAFAKLALNSAGKSVLSEISINSERRQFSCLCLTYPKKNSLSCSWSRSRFVHSQRSQTASQSELAEGGKKHGSRIRIRKEDNKPNISSDNCHCSTDDVKKVLGINEIQAKELFDKCPELANLKPDRLSSSSEYLLNNNINRNRILANPHVLLIEKGLLDTKIKIICTILSLSSSEVAVSFLKYKLTKIKAIGALWKAEIKFNPELKPFQNRLEYLAFHLKCSQIEIADMMGRVKYLTSMPFMKMQLVLNTLQECNSISPDNIVRDPWIFMHNVDTMKERIKQFNENNVEIKLWGLRSPPHKYLTHIKRTVRENKLKDNKDDITLYIQTRLQLSLSEATDVVAKVPLMKYTSAAKIDTMTTFLTSQGFTLREIAANARILRLRLETVSQKLTLLQELSGAQRYPGINNISLLCQNSAQFNRFIENITKTKTSQE